MILVIIQNTNDIGDNSSPCIRPFSFNKDSLKPSYLTYVLMLLY